VLFNSNKLCGRPPQYAPPLQVDVWPFDLESGVRVACYVGYTLPILVFLGLSVFDLGPMYATDRRQTDVIRASSLNAPTLGRGHNNLFWISGLGGGMRSTERQSSHLHTWCLQVCTWMWLRAAAVVSGPTPTGQRRDTSTGARVRRVAARLTAARRRRASAHGGAGAWRLVLADSWSTGGATRAVVGPSVSARPPQQPAAAVVVSATRCRPLRRPVERQTELTTQNFPPAFGGKHARMHVRELHGYKH